MLNGAVASRQTAPWRRRQQPLARHLQEASKSGAHCRRRRGNQEALARDQGGASRARTAVRPAALPPLPPPPPLTCMYCAAAFALLRPSLPDHWIARASRREHRGSSSQVLALQPRLPSILAAASCSGCMLVLVDAPSCCRALACGTCTSQAFLEQQQTPPASRPGVTTHMHAADQRTSTLSAAAAAAAAAACRPLPPADRRCRPALPPAAPSASTQHGGSARYPGGAGGAAGGWRAVRRRR